MFQLPGFRPQATPSYVPITGFLALVLCSGLSANLKERIYPGIDPPTRIASFRSLALSVSDSGVLALSRNPGGRNDLTYHFGENFAQVLTILTNRQALVLSGKGFVQGNKTFFALILDNKPYLLSIDEATRSFDLEEIDSEEKYFNSDLLVTDEGETWILVYDTALFQPRLARKTGNQAFEFIDLGLEGGVSGLHLWNPPYAACAWRAGGKTLFLGYPTVHFRSQSTGSCRR